MTTRLKASVQSLVFVIMLAATLFGTAGRFDIIEFWVYIAIVAAVSALTLAILDADLMQERMRPGGRRVGLHFLPLTIVLFLHWAVAGFDRGHLHLSDQVPLSLEVVALVLFALAWVALVWAMNVNRFFSSIPRIQSERGHTVISMGQTIADGVEQMVAEAAARAMAPIRLPMPIMGVLLTDQPNLTQFFCDDLMRGLGAISGA